MNFSSENYISVSTKIEYYSNIKGPTMYEICYVRLK